MKKKIILIASILIIVLIVGVGREVDQISQSVNKEEEQQPIKVEEKLGRPESRVRAHRTTFDRTIPDQIISHETITKIELNAETRDIQDEFDSATNYRFTAKRLGYYLVIGSVAYASPVADKVYWILFHKNGNVITEGMLHASHTGYFSIPIIDIIYLDAGDYLELYTYHNAGEDEIILADTYFTYMAISRLY